MIRGTGLEGSSTFGMTTWTSTIKYCLGYPEKKKTFLTSKVFQNLYNSERLFSETCISYLEKQFVITVSKYTFPITKIVVEK